MIGIKKIKKNEKGLKSNNSFTNNKKFYELFQFQISLWMYL